MTRSEHLRGRRTLRRLRNGQYIIRARCSGSKENCSVIVSIATTNHKCSFIVNTTTIRDNFSAKFVGEPKRICHKMAVSVTYDTIFQFSNDTFFIQFRRDNARDDFPPRISPRKQFGIFDTITVRHYYTDTIDLSCV